MRKRFVKRVPAYLAMIVAIVLLVGCNNSNQVVKGEDKSKEAGSMKKIELSTEIVSVYGDFGIEVPRGWSEDEEIINSNDLISLAASSDESEKSVFIIRYVKDELEINVPIEKFEEMVKKDLEANITDFKSGRSSEVKVNGGGGVQFEAQGVMNKEFYSFLVTIVDREDSFYQIIAYTTQNKYTKSKDEFKAIVQGFQVFEEDIEPSPSGTLAEQGGFVLDGSIYTSYSGRFEMRLPYDWEWDYELVDEAQLCASNFESEKYISVIEDYKSNLSAGLSVEGYFEYVKQNIQRVADNVVIEGPFLTQLDGKNAAQYIASGYFDDQEIAYLITIIDGEECFYQIMAWTLGELFEQYLEEFDAISQSFREQDYAVGGSKSESVAGNNKGLLVYGDSGTTLTLPEGWELNNSLNPDADFCAQNLSDDCYLLVIAERKSSLPLGMTLVEYCDEVADAFEDQLENCIISNEQEGTLNNYSAAQAEIEGIFSGIALKYLMTIVDTGDSFCQVRLWTSAHTYDFYYEELANIVDTFNLSY